MDASTSEKGSLPRALTALALAGIAVVIFAGMLHTPRFEPASASADPLKTVKIGLYGPRGTPLHKGDMLRTTDQISVTFNNPRLESTQIALFAVDTNGAAHWYAPLDRGGKREGVTKGLPTTQGEHALLPPTSIGDVPAGPLIFIALLNPGVIQLDRIDAFSSEERTPDALRDRFPDAVVLTWPVQLIGPPTSP